MFDAEINSGFTNGGDINISNHFTEITLLHKSGNGYTHVYKAKRYGQWHVLKCLTPEAAEQVQYQTLIEKEFRIAYPLSHPNIVRTLGIEDVPELGTCIIQEYIDGDPISFISREQAAELCDAVAYIHKAGVIHRDIKPDNVLVRKDNGHIVLIDFGLADKVDFCVLKGGAGTSQFAAPEQWTGDISPAIDIYGIGGVLALNKKLKRFANKCRKEDPQQRYPSALALKKALLHRFPWKTIFLIIIVVLLALISWGSWRYKQQLSIIQTRTELIDSLQSAQATNQERIEDLRRENDSTIQEIYRKNDSFMQTLNRENDSLTNRLRDAERKTHDLQNEMERTRGEYYRAIHEVNPMYNTYGRDNSAASQTY